ncbi:PD-(D/E)XK nuclease family protein [Fodinicola feengrottensis]|uniref:PD-(D/E)XK nuclease family protein n=2 Tax=Fodinicola feengrottensis TaxID=435914 RepID=A0ABP4UJM1_9ACTN
MTYVDRPQLPKGPPWAHNSMGASVHNALRGWFDLPVDQRTQTGIAGLLATGWLTDGFRDREQSEAVRARATDWVKDYVSEIEPSFEPVGLERTVATTTERLAVSGRVDRIDQRGGELVIVDYKTGRGELTSDDTRGSRALALYALAARRTLRRPCSRVELHHLPTGTVHAHEHTEESLARHVRRAEDTAADIVAATAQVSAGADAEAVFAPTPGPMCSWCDWRRHCPQGQAAAPAKASWVAVE